MLYPIYAASGLLALLLAADFYQKSKVAGWLKTATSGCLVVYCFFQYQESTSSYALLVIAAITFGVLGDVFLIFKDKRAFIAGMFAFLVGHLFYLSGFLEYDILLLNWIVAFAGISLAMLLVFKWIEKALKGILRYGVMAYMLVLGLMFSVGISIRMEGEWTLVAIGATLFTVSDFFVAAHRFQKARFINRLLGLPLYYLGQFILASSITHMQIPSF